MREQNNIDTYLLWNAEAFHLLYNDYYKALVSYAFSFIKSMEAAEDIVQGLFSTLYESKPQFDSVSSLEAYLYGATRNRCIN